MSKYIYIQKDAANIYVTMPEKLDTANNDIGTTWEDYVAGKYVLLTEEQIAFKEANEGASVEEVFNMQLTPIPEPKKTKSRKRLETSGSLQHRLPALLHRGQRCVYIRPFVSKRPVCSKRYG